MKRKIYINESMANDPIFRERLLKESLSKSLVDDIINHKTSLGSSDILERLFGGENAFVEKLNNFHRLIKTHLRYISDFDIENMSLEDEESLLNELIIECQKIERPIRTELEQCCYNFIVDFFDVPDETISFEMNLVDSVTNDNSSVRFDSIDGDDYLEAPSDLKDEIYKHRFLSMIAMGAGVAEGTSSYDEYADLLKSVNEDDRDELCRFYELITALVLDILFKKKIELNEKESNLMGYSEIVLGSEDEIVKIKAEGTIFPILLIETIRGLVELFISHGLPKDKKEIEYVLGKTEFMKTEAWDMRMGTFLWEILIKGDIDSKELPYFLKFLSLVPANMFNEYMYELISDTEEGKELKSKMFALAKEEYQKNNFNDRMGELGNKSMITDEYFYPDEF